MTYLSVEEVAEQTGISETEILEALKSGALPCVLMPDPNSPGEMIQKTDEDGRPVIFDDVVSWWLERRGKTH